MMISRVARKQKTRQYKELMHFIYPGQGPGAVSPFRVVPHPLEHQLGKDSLMSMTLVIVCGTESINAQIQMSKAFYNLFYLRKHKQEILERSLHPIPFVIVTPDHLLHTGCTLPPSSMSLVISPDHQSLCLHPNNPWHFPWGSLETASFNEESMKESRFNVISVEYLVLKCLNFYITLTLAYHKFYARNHNTYKNTTSVLATLCQSLHTHMHVISQIHSHKLYVSDSSTHSVSFCSLKSWYLTLESKDSQVFLASQISVKLVFLLRQILQYWQHCLKFVGARSFNVCYCLILSTFCTKSSADAFTAETWVWKQLIKINRNRPKNGSSVSKHL